MGPAECKPAKLVKLSIAPQMLNSPKIQEPPSQPNGCQSLPNLTLIGTALSLCRTVEQAAVCLTPANLLPLFGCTDGMSTYIAP